MLTLPRGRLVPRQPRTIKDTTRTELRDEIIVVTMILIIKHKMVCVILGGETYQNSAAFAPYHPVICVILAFCLRHITKENDENR